MRKQQLRQQLSSPLSLLSLSSAKRLDGLNTKTADNENVFLATSGSTDNTSSYSSYASASNTSMQSNIDASTIDHKSGHDNQDDGDNYDDDNNVIFRRQLVNEYPRAAGGLTSSSSPSTATTAGKYMTRIFAKGNRVTLL